MMTEASEGGHPWRRSLGWGSTENVLRLLGLLWGGGELESPWVASNFPLEREESSPWGRWDGAGLGSSG